MSQARRVLVLLCSLLAALAVASVAGAEVVVVHDAAGRPIRFDVRADVDAGWYADVLLRAAHGDEIARVTVRIVEPAAIRSECGPGAAGCYARGVIVVPGVESAATRHTLLHEYGHHLDAATPVPGVPEPNGTPRWWQARELESLTAGGLVARDYALGWSRAIGEIFAEDYAQLHERFPYKIGWLQPPAGAVAKALRADLAGEPPTPVHRPVEVVRRGVIRPGETRTLPFGLLGPGRRVTFGVTVGAAGSQVAARIEIRCGARVFSRAVRAGGALVVLDRRGLGPARCEVALVSADAAALRYVATLRLAGAVRRSG